VVAQYAKIHLFDVDLPSRVTARESDHFQPGDEVVTFPVGWGTAGLAICYDLRFPELFRALIDRGAQLLLVPSAFTRTTGADHWELLARARAVESQAFVVAANQVGQHSAQSASFGHSLVVDPWGNVMAKGDGERECVLHAELDRAVLDEIRTRLPALRHRRLSLKNA
jgi:predicted amidohydrolase